MRRVYYDMYLPQVAAGVHHHQLVLDILTGECGTQVLQFIDEGAPRTSLPLVMYWAAVFALAVVGERRAESPHAIVSSAHKKAPNITEAMKSVSLRFIDIVAEISTPERFDAFVATFESLRNPLHIPAAFGFCHPSLAQDLKIRGRLSHRAVARVESLSQNVASHFVCELRCMVCHDGWIRFIFISKLDLICVNRQRDGKFGEADG